MEDGGEFSIPDLQPGKRGCHTLQTDILEEDIYDLIIILDAAVQHHALIPNRVVDPHAGMEPLFDDGRCVPI